MSSVRVELGDLSNMAGKATGGFMKLWCRVRAVFRDANEQLSQDTFTNWFLGFQFPRTQRRQDLLGDAVGGKIGQSIKDLREPAFRHFRGLGTKDKAMSSKGKRSREFLLVSRPDESGKMVKQSEIRCVECSRAHHYKCRGSLEAEEYFRNKGWEVGADEGRDFCAECVAKRKVVRMEDHRKPPQAGPQSVQAEREMTKEDGRLIFKAIESHWDDNAKGYCPGWSDQKIATTEGVPVAWVKDIRERDYGGVGEDPTFQLFIADQILIKTEMEAIQKVHDELAGSVANINKLVTAYKEKHLRLWEKVQTLTKIAERIQAPNPFRDAG